MNTKLCTKCNIIKSFDDYNKSKNRKYGIACHCRSCMKIERKEYRAKETSIVLIRECRSRYNKKHPETRLTYYLNNIDKRTEYNKKYRENNIEHYNNKATIYRKKSRNILSDGYIKSQLSKVTSLKHSQIPQELVELKRIQLKTYRLCQQLQN